MFAIEFSGVLDVRLCLFGRTWCSPLSFRAYLMFAVVFSGVLDVRRCLFGRT